MNTIQNPSPHDWPEDWADPAEDNGCYNHICTKCHTQFLGHKRRRNTCRVCAKERGAEVERRAAMLAQIGLDRKDWVLIPSSEWSDILNALVLNVMDAGEERALRRKLAAALAIAHKNAVGLHYHLYSHGSKDSDTLLAESAKLDESLENRKKEA